MLTKILVFKTSVEDAKHASTLVALLDALPSIKQSNFDLDDCDRILRVVTTDVCPREVEQLLSEIGFSCEELE